MIGKIQFAYWAGFIATDGYLHKPKNKKEYIGIKLQIKDKAHLQKIKNMCNINFYERHKMSYEARIFDDKIISKLKNKYNITERKSFTYKPPSFNSVNEKLSFLIGLLDGDGSIGVYDKGFTIQFTSASLELITFVKECFDSLDTYQDSRQKKISKIRKDRNYFKYSVAGKRAKNIYNKLKSIKVLKLNRKWCFNVN